jgi:hypothetical protein
VLPLTSTAGGMVPARALRRVARAENAVACHETARDRCYTNVPRRSQINWLTLPVPQTQCWAAPGSSADQF